MSSSTLFDNPSTVKPVTPEAEEWRPVVGYEGIYEVSNIGRVRRSHDAPVYRSTARGKLLSPSISRGYRRVMLCRRGERINHSVHRLVAAAFIGPPPADANVINHIDCDKFNNYATNLEWVSPLQNTRHAWNNQLVSPSRGGCHYMAKLNDGIILEIVAKRRMGATLQELGRQYGVSPITIFDVCRGKTWKHVERPGRE